MYRVIDTNNIKRSVQVVSLSNCCIINYSITLVKVRLWREGKVILPYKETV